MTYRPVVSALLTRRIVLTVGAVALMLQWGCHSYLPVQSAPPAVQERAAVVLSDRGRTMMGDKLGPLVEQVDGIIQSADSSGVVLSVVGTRDVRGGSSLWSGERVEIPADAVLGYRVRQLSKPRSYLLAGSLVAAIAVLTFGLSLDLFGFERSGSETQDPLDPGIPISFRGRGAVSLP
jgi:hypothetical protein